MNHNTRQHFRRLIAIVAFSVLATLIMVGASSLGWLSSWRSSSYSILVRSTAKPTPVPEKIKMILIDDVSLDRIERLDDAWPWSTVLYLDLLAFLDRAGAKVVIFDITFPRHTGEVRRSEDEAFGQEASNYENLVMAMSFRTVDESQLSLAERFPELKLQQPKVNLKYQSEAKVYNDASWPNKFISPAMKKAGHVHSERDEIGIARSLKPYVIFGDNELYPRMEMVAVAVAEAMAGRSDEIHIHEDQIQIGELYALPRASDGHVHLRFRQPKTEYAGYAYPAFSAFAVMQSEWRLQDIADGIEDTPPPTIDPAEFKDAYVIIGGSAASLHDIHATPMDPKDIGPQLVATSLDNILTDSYLVETPLWLDWLWVLLLSLLGAAAATYAKRAWLQAIVFIVLIPLPWLVGLMVFDSGYFLPVVAPTLAMAIALFGASVYSYATEGAQKRFIQKAFSHYISPIVVSQIVKNPDLLKLGGERRELSIFFSDLQGFSSISEGMDPTDLIAMLNDYLTEMVGILREENGTLDKFEGDAIIAFWNAPLDEHEHQLKSVRCALRCQRRLTERNPDFNKMCGRDLKMRIGINTGPVVVGNMGGKDRFDYSMLGNAANLAARLEGANKAFGTLLMISEWTYEGCKDEFIFRETALIRVVGIEQPVRVYEPLCFSDEARPEWLDTYEKALAELREGNLEAAVEVFEQLPDDPVAQTYLEKIGSIKASGESSWDGIFNLTSK